MWDTRFSCLSFKKENEFVKVLNKKRDERVKSQEETHTYVKIFFSTVVGLFFECVIFWMTLLVVLICVYNLFKDMNRPTQ